MADQIGKTNGTIELRKWKKGGGFDGAGAAKTLSNSELVKKIHASKKYTSNDWVQNVLGTVAEAEATFETRRPFYEIDEDMFIYTDNRILQIVEILPHPKLKRWIIIRTKRVFNHE